MSNLSLLRVRWPATPVDGQSLLGLMVDTAHENKHDDIGSILTFAQLGTVYGVGRTMRSPEARAALAFTLRQPQDVVDLRSNQLTDPIAGMDTVDFFGARVPAFDVLYDRRRVGDSSVPGFYHKAAWQLIHLPVDVDDGAVIVDRCQSCGARLGWRTIDHAGACGAYKAANLDYGRLGFAGRSYDCGTPGCGANHQPDRVSPETLSGLSLLAKLIDPRASVHGPVREALHPDLSGLDRGIVFYLGLKLGRAIGLEGKGTRLRRAAAAPFEEALKALQVGSSIIAGWPGSVSTALRDKAAIDHEHAMAAIEGIRSVCFGESAWPEHTEIMGHAIPDLVNGHYQHVIRRLLPDIVDGKEAARIIGIRTHSMAALIRGRVLKPVIARGSSKIHGSFKRADVEEVAEAVRDSVEATALVEDYGIPLHAVEQLICMRLLDRADHPAVTALYPKLRITRSSRDRLEADLRSAAGCDESDPVLPMRQALLGIGAREKPWGEIIASMIDGRIRFRLARPAGRLMDRVDVAMTDDLELALASVFDRAAYPDFEFAREMRQRDAIELLNIDPSRWQKIAKLLPAATAGPGKTVVVDEILKVAAEIIDAREAKQRWDVRLDRASMIDGGVGWDRARSEEEFD